MISGKGTFYYSSVELQIKVTSGGVSVEGATVTFYIDGMLLGTSISSSGRFSTGVASITVTSTPYGHHSWYAVAVMPGYISATSPTGVFVCYPPSSPPPPNKWGQQP